MPGTPAARRLAEDFAGIAREYLQRGDAGRAIELYEEAYGWDDENGVLLAELTLAYVRAENFPFARFYLELAERMAPRAPPEAYAVLGDVYDSLQRLEDAVLAWEQFERLGGDNPRILKRLANTREELSVASGQKSRDTGSFRFFFDAAIPGGTVDAIQKRLELCQAEQSGFFGMPLPASQVVVLYAGRSYFTLVSIPDWVSGVFDGKIRISLDPDDGVTPALEGVLCHEIAHAFLRRASADRAPGWLHEGLAQWWEGKRILRREFRELFRGKVPHSLTEMEGNLARQRDRATAQTNYVEALGLVEYLMQSRGIGSLACLVADLGGGASLSEALRKETGLSSEELVSRWRIWAGI